MLSIQRQPIKILIAVYTLVGVLGLTVVLEIAFNFGIFMPSLILAYLSFYGVIGLIIVGVVILSVRGLKKVEDRGL